MYPNGQLRESSSACCCRFGESPAALSAQTCTLGESRPAVDLNYCDRGTPPRRLSNPGGVRWRGRKESVGFPPETLRV
jgi:hypothetical protein